MMGKVNLIPADPKRCQAEMPNGENFMTLGGGHKMVRCKNKPSHIATEKQADEYGQHGGMTPFAAEAPGSGGKVKLLCKVLGHLHPSGAQVFASVEQREADGAWLAVRGWCKRCDARPLLGSLWVQDYTARTLADAGKRESANARDDAASAA